MIAEGVETKDQANYLKDRKCDLLQGFYYSMPVPATEIPALMDVDYNSPREETVSALASQT